MWRFGSHATIRDNPDGGITTQPARLRQDMRFGMPILCRGNTGRWSVGVARTAQRVGEKVHSLPRAEGGEL